MKKSNKVLALLGKDTNFEGKLTFEGTVRIDGHFEGEITAVGNLIVGRSAMVNADVKISCILISGEVHGNIQATQSIEILPQGHICGTIEAPKIVVHEGALLQGHCQTQEPGAKTEDALDLDLPPEEPLLKTLQMKRSL